MLKAGERLDDLELKGLKIIQNPDWFCFGIDAVLLSSYAVIRKKDRVVDLGTGTGIIPLLVYGKYEPKEIIGVEIQKDVADMARRSIELNGLTDIIKIYEGDIKDCFKYIGINQFDVVVSNPPYKKGSSGILNMSDTKAISRHEVLINIDELCFSASRLLKGGGRFYMIHRPERLKDIILALNNNKFTPKRIRFVHPKINKAPNMVLIESVKAGGDFLKIEEPLYVYNDDGTYTQEILKIYGRC
ncbi:tRNA1(Val) (adenine(37)-N6)-methyltransferase [Thermobrachium celere]|uniref:COG4123: Predicted O-methyltransferase n=1 Tax=Thermobrachium celere DSM 8682 TaxID=941824 RepID=R7RPM4_9CLOT|nr:tRNA1(Val) (adenine(37)-N6)-methyltransferase [Thermobrachium celere]GFR34475.1 methyltransferase [Thermobrachium celere]CDF57180.1 COG4123: Predicted O-methyltransferase [Thermobrachium celere DSM 8682]